MAFFRQFLHAKANFSDRKYVSMSLKKSNLHAKTAQNWQIALFNYFCLSELFAALYIANNLALFIIKESKLSVADKKCASRSLEKSNVHPKFCKKLVGCATGLVLFQLFAKIFMNSYQC